MVIDFTITIGNIIEIISILGGGFIVLLTIKADVKSLQQGAKMLQANISALQAEVKKLSEILIDLADIRGELKVLGTKVAAVEEDIRQLRTQK